MPIFHRFLGALITFFRLPVIMPNLIFKRLRTKVHCYPCYHPKGYLS